MRALLRKINCLLGSALIYPVIVLTSTLTGVAFVPQLTPLTTADTTIVRWTPGEHGHSAPTVLLTEPIAIITVNSTADTNSRDSVLTLREAILIANGTLPKSSLTFDEQMQVSGVPTGSSFDQIRFNIPGVGLHTIRPGSPLAAITDSVTIDGTTQPGFDNKPIIEINGTNAGPGANGLEIRAQACTIKGLAIYCFFLGSGIVLAPPVRPSSDVESAGTAAGNNKIIGNHIGTDSSGVTSLGNRIGISVSSSNNAIGGATAAERNVISGNREDGIRVSVEVAGTVVQGNLIGIGADGITAVGNGIAEGGSGVLIGGSQNIVGVRVNPDGTISGMGNTIAFNQGDGITAGLDTRNALVGNSIFSNGLKPINIASSDPNSNRNNPPVLNQARTFLDETNITGSFMSTPKTDFYIFYNVGSQCGGSDSEQRIVRLPDSFQTGDDGSYVIRKDYTGPPNSGLVTSNVYNPATRATSELSNCIEIISCTASLSESNQSYPADGGTGGIAVLVTNGCSWTAKSNDDWIIINSFDNSTGRVQFEVKSNISTKTRNGTMTVAGRTFAITEKGLGLRIGNVLRDGKNLLVIGENFDSGAVILKDGEPQRTKHDEQDSNTLIGKKLVKLVTPGATVRIQVQNSDGQRSNEFPWMRQ